jgi:hypothetical protein
VAEQWEALQAAEQARQQERDRRTAAERALQAAQAAQQQERDRRTAAERALQAAQAAQQQERDQRTAAERALQEAQAAQQQAEHVQETAALLEQERRAQPLGSMPSAPAPVPTGFAPDLGQSMEPQPELEYPLSAAVLPSSPTAAAATTTIVQLADEGGSGMAGKRYKYVAVGVAVLLLLTLGAIAFAASASSTSPPSTTMRNASVTPAPTPTTSAGSLPVGSVSAKLTLMCDIATIPPNSPERKSFERKFRNDIASKLSVSSDRIRVTEISVGSIVISFSILPDEEGTMILPVKLAKVFSEPVSLSSLQISTEGSIEAIAIETGTVSCADLHQGTCMNCSTKLKSDCSEVTCFANAVNADGIVSNGCEVGCAKLPAANCTACDGTSTSDCVALTCASNHFNSDGNISNGCEVGCALVSNGKCTKCLTPDASGCLMVNCTPNTFSIDGSAASGCEAGCATGANTVGPASACTSASASGITTLAACVSNRFNTDGVASNGCETNHEGSNVEALVAALRSQVPGTYILRLSGPSFSLPALTLQPFQVPRETHIVAVIFS